MTTPKPQANSGSYLSLAGQFGLWLVLSVALLRLPRVPQVDPLLDTSWQLCISYLVQHGRQFGSDVIFTFGPLGFVMSGLYCGSGFWLQFLAMAAASGIFGWVLAESIRPLKWPMKLIAVLGVIFLVSRNLQSEASLILALLGVLLLRGEPPGRIKTAFACAALSFLSLAKFTNFMLAAFIVSLAAATCLLAGRWRRAAFVVACFAVSLFCLWIALGQSPAGAFGYIRTSLEISRGYDTMALYEQPRETASGLAMALLIAAWCVFEAATAKPRGNAWPTALLLLAATYLNWKHGYIRAGGGHTLGFYLWVLAVPLFYPLYFSYGRRWQAGRLGFAILLATFAFTSACRLEPDLVTDYVPRVWEGIRQNVIALANLPKFERDLNSQFAQVAAANAAPRIDKTLGRDSVDVLGFEQSIAIYNGLNYTPRPIFQSYSAYTPMLAALNAGYIAGDTAPQWILQRYETIDGRYPSSDDALTLRALLDRYTYQFQDSGYIVWRRTQTADTTLAASLPVAREGEARLKQEIPVGDLAAKSALWLEIDYSFTLAGSLRGLLYKPPKVTMIVTASDQPGVPRKFLMPQLIAREGMMLSPYLAGEYDFLKYAAGFGGPTIQSFKIVCARQDAKYLKRNFHYRLLYLPAPANLSANQSFAGSIRQYPMFDSAPARVDSTSPPVAVWQDGRVMLQVGAPSRIEFPVPAGGGRLTGAFALRTADLDSEQKSNVARPVVEFQVALREGSAQRILFDRVLDPLEAPSDGGVQPLDVNIPPAAPGATLLLNTISKSPGGSGWALACWTSLRLREDNPAAAGR